MKFTMNGALTIGTLDGANVEIRAAVGEENFFLFGKTVQHVDEILAAGYRPRDIYRNNANLRDVIDLINSGHFSHGDGALFRPLIDNLLEQRPFPGVRGFSGLRRLPSPGGRGLPGPGSVDAHVHPERGALREILFRSRHPRVQHGHMACAAVAGSDFQDLTLYFLRGPEYGKQTTDASFGCVCSGARPCVRVRRPESARSPTI